MYISSILWYLSWPVLIIVSYYLIRFALKRFEKHLPEKD
jgi:hypothetical protein